MTSQAINTQGTTLGIATAGASPLVYTAIGEMTSFKGFDGKAAEIDVTHLLSTAKEFRMGLQDWGSFTMDVNYLPADAGQIALRSAKGSGVAEPFQLTLSSGDKYTFLAFVTSLPISGGVDSKLDGSYELRITGDVTFTAHS